MLEFGYIRLYRSLLDWEWYTDSNTKDVFIHLMLTANYEAKKWKGITIERGQRVYSAQKLADELHMSRQTIRTAIKHLISTGEITNEPTPEYSIITVKNYDSYQQLTNCLTNEQPTPNQRATNDQPQCKKDKESNKDKKDKKDICADTFAEYANGDPELLKALNDYAEMRKQKRKPLSTDRAIKMLFNSLNKLATDNQSKIAILNQSVFNNWTGVFPLKDNQQQKPNKPEKQYSFDLDLYEQTSQDDVKYALERMAQEDKAAEKKTSTT